MKVELYITDKNGGKMFKEICGKGFEESVKRDLQRHLESAKLNPKMYNFLDLETAKIEINYI